MEQVIKIIKKLVPKHFTVDKEGTYYNRVGYESTSYIISGNFCEEFCVNSFYDGCDGVRNIFDQSLIGAEKELRFDDSNFRIILQIDDNKFMLNERKKRINKIINNGSV